MARILVIDDDRGLCDMLAMAIEDAGHTVHTAPDGLRGHQAATSLSPDLLVSDVNMPGLDGFSLCRRLREEGVLVPIVLLTARDTEIDEALGLELGADDYIVKPFHARVLLARISALLRREAMRHGSPGGAELSAGGLSLDLDRLEARYQGQRLQTTVTEFRLLVALAERPGVVFSRAQLLDRMRGDNTSVVERLVDTYVRRLRRKLEAIDPTFGAIETVIGAGYRWQEASAGA